MKLRMAIASTSLLLATIANAASTDQVGVTTTVLNSCTFTTPNIVASIPNALGDTVVGNVGFSCNYVGSVGVDLKVPGGTFLVSGSKKIRYAIKWGLEDPAPANFWSTPAPISNVTFGLTAQTSITPNTSVSGPVTVRLEQVATIAGTYSSVATFTFTP